MADAANGSHRRTHADQLAPKCSARRICDASSLRGCPMAATTTTNGPMGVPAEARRAPGSSLRGDPPNEHVAQEIAAVLSFNCSDGQLPSHDQCGDGRTALQDHGVLPIPHSVGPDCDQASLIPLRDHRRDQHRRAAIRSARR